MSAAVDSYHVTAKYYDGAYSAKQDLVDLPFYLDLAEQSRGPILEIACGTGRVLLPIARKGIEIHGVDNSLPMLEILRHSLSGEPDSVRRRVVLHEADMRNFHLGVQYPLVIIPFRPCSICTRFKIKSARCVLLPCIFPSEEFSRLTSSIQSLTRSPQELARKWRKCSGVRAAILQ